MDNYHQDNNHQQVDNVDIAQESLPGSRSQGDRTYDKEEDVISKGMYQQT